MYICGHSYEFDKHNNWELMESICEKPFGKEDLWYATNMNIYQYVEGYNRLKCSADGRLVRNPNLFTVWFEVDRKLYSVEPGQTVRVEE